MSSQHNLIINEPSSPCQQKNKNTLEKIVIKKEDSTELTLDEKVDLQLNQIHGNGRFSCFALFAIASGVNAIGYWFYNMTYLTMKPKFTNCVFTDPQPLSPESACTSDNICSGQVLSYEIDWNDIYSLHNWVDKLDLTCCPRWKVGMIGSMYFIGWVITLPWVPKLSDSRSRKTYFLIAMLIDLAVYIMMFFANSVEQMILLVFVVGLANSIRMNIGFVYLMELIPKRLQGFYSAVNGNTEGIIPLVGTLYFWFLSNNWIGLYVFGLTL